MFHFGYPPLMRRMYEDEGEQLTHMFSRVKQLGLTTSLDLAKPDPESAAGQAPWKRILQCALPHVDVFLPSVEELLYMLDRDTYLRLEDEYGPGEWLKAVDGSSRRYDRGGRLYDCRVPGRPRSRAAA